MLIQWFWILCILFQVYGELLPQILGELNNIDFSPQLDEVKDSSLTGQYKSLSDASLLWGPYRSGLYFGIRPRIPRSLLSGLMWFNVDQYGGIGKMRHFYEQHDPMKKANWIYYDPRIGGRQVIVDKECHIKLVFDFIKTEDGKSWAVKVKTIPQKGYENVKTSFVWYSGLESEMTDIDIYGEEGQNGVINLDNDRTYDGAYKKPISLSGASESLGFFTLVVGEQSPNSANKRPEPIYKAKELDPRLNYHISLRIPNDQSWQAKDIFATLIQDSLKDLMEKYGQQPIPPEQSFLLRDINHFQGNFHFVQQVYTGACEFFVRFENALTPKEQLITVENFDEKAKLAFDQIDQKYHQHFNLVAPFDKLEYQPFAKEILSGLLGGLSYFYGDQLVDRVTKLDEESFESMDFDSLKPQLEGPSQLFTLVPSRPFFPRGFLWDEGFHLLPLLDYDSDLVLEILQSWFGLIDENGWIAREQILGPELRSRVPEAFQIQSPKIVNPPTLMLTFTFLLEQLQKEQQQQHFGNIDEPIQEEDYGGFEESLNGDKLGKLVFNNPQVLKNYTRNIYPQLKAHYEMFRRTQKGYVDDFGRNRDMEVYRWRGRTISHSLASGLDDYPRALPVDIAELNVDLLSWIGVMTRSVKMIAEVLGEYEDVKKYQVIEQRIIKDLNEVHWSDEQGIYCDKSVDEDDEDVFACFKGYISIFPFITKMMDPLDFHRLDRIVQVISDPNDLWTDYGLRSMAKSDPAYKSGENYWTSPIWMNINYLALDALKHYKTDALPEPLAQKISTTYKNLRVNAVQNVYKEWKKTGFVWEQYDDETGASKGAKNFLGWTSSVILMMNMPQEI